MKCLSKSSFLLLILIFACSIGGCGKKEIDVKYGKYNLPENYNIDSKYLDNSVPLFATNLCANDEDITSSSSIDTSSIYAAGVYDVDNCETLYSYLAFDRVSPASLTKVMTALVVLENCSLDEVVNIPDVRIYEDGIQLFGLKEGDSLTVRDLLYIDLVYSGNDASLALAKYVAGSEEAFAEIMNEKARALGATHSNFVNSHGLSNENHYTTAYDLYLIFNAALKYDEFVNIINAPSYTINYANAAGERVEKTIYTTNKFLEGTYKMPDSANIVGGKTGSTYAAGKCLIVCSTGAAGNRYISVVMGAQDEASLYSTMTKLLDETIK